MAVAVSGAAVVAMSPAPAGALGFPPGTLVVSPPTSIATDCSVDVTKPLYDWLNSLPEGTASQPTEVLFAAGGCYQVDGMLFLRGFTDFILNGNGSIFRQSALLPHDITNDSPPNRPAYCGDSTDFLNAFGTRPSGMDIMWLVEGGCDIVMENMDIEGKNTSGIGSSVRLSQDAGIQLSGVQRAVVANNTIHGVYGDFVTVAGLHEAPSGGPAFPALDVTIENNTMHASGRQGVTVVYGQRVAVTGNSIVGNIPDSAIDFESDVLAGTEADISVSNNTLASYTWLLSARTGAHLYDIAFTNNSVGAVQVRMDPLTSTNGHDVTFSGNTSMVPTFWSKSYNLVLGNLATALISGNTVPMHPPSTVFVHVGLRHASTDVAVQNNTLSPSSSAPPNFLPVPLSARQNVKVTECNNSTSGGTPLDTNAHPPNRVQCVAWTPVQPVAPALPVYATP